MSTLSYSVRFCLLGFGLLAVVLTNSCSPDKPPLPTILRLAAATPAEHPSTLGCQYLAELVNQRSGGRLLIRVQNNAKLGPEASVLEETRLGAIDLALVQPVTMAALSPTLAVLYLPYLYHSDEHMQQVLAGPVGTELLESLGPVDLTGLAYFTAGSRNIFNRRREISTPADLSGLRLRVAPQSSLAATVQALGAIAVPLPFGDTYKAIQNGNIDGAEGTILTYLADDYHEVAKYYTFDGHQRLPDILVMSSISFFKLGDQDQAIIRQAAREASAWQFKRWAEAETKARSAAIAAGCTITELDAASLTRFQASVQALLTGLDSQQQALVNRIRTP